MSNANFVRCWVVNCKTKDCKYLYLDRAGSNNRAFHGLHPVFDDFKATRPKCGIEYTYSQPDLEEHNLDDPPKGYCKEFRDAIEQASKRLALSASLPSY